ncbi:MAG TPA: PhzF family phenazine biosynthesis protein [Anaerolineae bacterium]|nr:PhzF family phenazine biosynthesis protein [Anaerolineae bacterium]
MTQAITIVQVDTFTKKPFQGNPAVVCFLATKMPDEWMLHVSQEINLSETAFLLPYQDGWDLRWFSPTVEVDLCGHATLASAHALWETARLAPTAEARFHTRTGVLVARQADGWIEMDFPSMGVKPTTARASFWAAMGLAATPIYKGGQDLFIPLPHEQAVRDLKPDFVQLLGTTDVRGIAVAAPSQDRQYDFVFRFFAPNIGINEDSATGSVHCYLAPYWATVLNKTSLRAYQLSTRTGRVRTTVRPNRVLIGGQAVTVMKGELAALLVS